MNKYLQILFLVLFPFYPFWAWAFLTGDNKEIVEYANLLWLGLFVFLLIIKSNRFPKYLVFLMLFTAYHLGSVYYFNLVPPEMTWVSFIRQDLNVYACAVLFVIENTKFEGWFFEKMNRNILIIVAISALVSLVQVADPMFFLNQKMDVEMDYTGTGRIFSIYSWTNINSLGISFPIMISILLSVISTQKKTFPIVVISGLLVAFLSRARYIMISTIIAFSQLLITSTIALKRKVYFVLILFFSVVVLMMAAQNSGFNLQEVIQDRILEKSNETEMGSAMVRVTSYYVFLLKFPEHPMLGVGPKTRNDVIQLLGGEAPLIHVGYLSYLYYYGILGFLLLMISIFFLLKRAWKTGRKHEFWGSFYGIITFCFANTTFVYFNMSEMGIILAVIYLKIFEDKQEMELAEEKDSQELLPAVLDSEN
ncbi:MAG: O-antigen ligase family protein [Bacteroidales bacterium]